MSELEARLHEAAVLFRNENEQLRAEVGRLRGLLANSEMTVAEVMADNERLTGGKMDDIVTAQDRAQAEITRQQRVIIRLHKKIDRLKAAQHNLRALLDDKQYIQCKADYNRGHLSHANYLNSKENK